MKAIISLLTLSAVSCYSEEAPYEVMQEFDGWEVRMYPPTKWISTDALDVYPHDGLEHSKAFNRLFNYIDGSNEMNSKIPMTAPVTYRILPGPGPNCESNYTMSFYIPSDLEFSSKAAMLYEMAQEEGLSVKDVPLWTAGYSGPSVIINRRNEVWLEL